MSYMGEICTALTRVLKRTATLEAHQAAGHAANLDFWRAEVVHALGVLDGYRDRFQRLRDGQIAYVRRTGDVLQRDEYGETIRSAGPPPKRGIPTAELKQLRVDLCDTWHRCVSRMAKLELIDSGRAGALSELTERKRLYPKQCPRTTN